MCHAANSETTQDQGGRWDRAACSLWRPGTCEGVFVTCSVLRAGAHFKGGPKQPQGPVEPEGGQGGPVPHAGPLPPNA